MIPYPKTQNIYRGHGKDLERGVFRMPEVEMLSQLPIWHATEKLDGTNMRIIIAGAGTHEVRGRTDKADLGGSVAGVVEYIKETLPPAEELATMFPYGVTLYGEGIGPGIQKGGKYGRKRFVMFDMLSHGNNPSWYDPRHVMLFAEQLGFEYPCVLGAHLKLTDAVAIIEGGMQEWLGIDYPPEGLIAVPEVVLLNRWGERIKAKLKVKDFHP